MKVLSVQVTDGARTRRIKDIQDILYSEVYRFSRRRPAYMFLLLAATTEPGVEAERSEKRPVTPSDISLIYEDGASPPPHPVAPSRSSFLRTRAHPLYLPSRPTSSDRKKLRTEQVPTTRARDKSNKTGKTFSIQHRRAVSQNPPPPPPFDYSSLSSLLPPWLKEIPRYCIYESTE